jgi:hypothetical protein
VVHVEGYNVALCVCAHTGYTIVTPASPSVDTYTPGYCVRTSRDCCHRTQVVAQLDGTGKWGEFTYEASRTKQISAFLGLGIKVM